MARPCSICQHPRLYDINNALAAREIAGRKAGFTYRSIAEEFKVSKDALKNHWRGEGHKRAPNSPGAQYALLGDGSKALVVPLEALVEKALAIGFRNMINHPKTLLAGLPKADSQGPNEGGGVRQLGGHVYLLHLLSGGAIYKIGRAAVVDGRINQISPALPWKSELICAIRTNNMYVLEARLHKRFADKRTNGEWFDLEPADVEYMKAMALIPRHNPPA